MFNIYFRSILNKECVDLESTLTLVQKSSFQMLTHHFGFGMEECLVKSVHCRRESLDRRWSMKVRQVEWRRALALVLWRKSRVSDGLCLSERDWWGDGVWQIPSWTYRNLRWKEWESGLEMMGDSRTSVKNSLWKKRVKRRETALRVRGLCSRWQT